MEGAVEVVGDGGEAMTFEFNEDSFVRRDESLEAQMTQRAEFVNFVRDSIATYPLETRVLKFSLTISRPDYHAADINEFINFAVLRGVIHFELDFSDPTWDENSMADSEQGFPLPQPVYQHENFQSLKLYGCALDVAMFASLQSLSILSLGWTTITLEAVQHIFGSCPVLNSLSLKQCHGIAGLTITAPNSQLRKLVIDNCNIDPDHVLLEGPRLREFRYSGRVAWFFFDSRWDLLDVHLDFGAQDKFEAKEHLLELTEQLFAVRNMTVCSVFLQMVPSVVEWLHTNGQLALRHLTLNTELHVNEFIGIQFMLASSPRLKTITLCLRPGKIFQDYIPPYPFDPQTFWLHPVHAEDCLRRSLTILNVKDFHGTANELKLISFVMAFGRRLKKVKIYFPKTEAYDDTSFNAFAVRANPLHGFPKANPRLQIRLARTF